MKNPFKGVASSYGGTSGQAALDLAHNTPVAASKHNNGLIMAALHKLGLVGKTRFPIFRMPFMSAAKHDAPRPGKDAGF